jgi:hypothetical protein
MPTATRFLSVVAALLGVLLSTNSARAQVLINEFSAANYQVIADNFGEYEDWIELYNAGSAAVDLSGYHLSDRADEPTKWPIPAGTSIGAGGFLRFWCSGRDLVSGSHYHTNFKVTQTRNREGIYFNSPAGLSLDSNGIAVPNQRGHSWGRFPDGAADWVVFTSSSPGAANAGPRYQGYAAKPVISPEPGAYAGATPITITSGESGVTLRYTTNGSRPTAASPEYTAPLSLSATAVVRAAAFPSDPNLLPSLAETNTYLMGTAAAHTLPVISLAGEGLPGLFAGSFTEPIGSFEFFAEGGSFLVEAVGDFNKHGNDSWFYPQRGVDYVVRDQLGYSGDVNYPIFPQKDRNRYQRLILKAAANDNYPFENGAHIRDAFVHTLSQAADLRMDERTSRSVIVYVNGQYWGVYEVREKVDDHDFTDHYYDQGEFDIDFIKTWGATWVEYGSIADWGLLFNYIMSNDMADPGHYAYVDERFNTGSLIDYTILHSWMVCADWLNWNTAWWRGRNPEGDKRKWRYILWDNDASFGHYVNYTGIPDTGPMADPCDPTTLDSWSDPEGHMTILNRLMLNEGFRTDYINRWADLNNGFLNCSYTLPFLDSMVAVIRPEMPAQIARWGGSMTAWENQVEALRTFIQMRCDYIVDGMEDCFGEEAWPLTLIVEPPGAGKIQVNTFLSSTFPFESVYLGGIDLSLQALEESDYLFERWEMRNHTPSPDLTSPETTVQLSARDTLIAWFRIAELPSFPITVEVYPPGAGTVSINALEPTSYPWSGAYTSGSLVSVSANPAPGYTFGYWNLFNQFINPSATSPEASFSIAAGDTLQAWFSPLSGLNNPASPLAAFSVFPSPSAGPVQAHFYLERAAETSLSLMTPFGQELAMVQAPALLSAGAHRAELDLNALGLPAGLYLLALRSEGYMQTARLVYMP